MYVRSGLGELPVRSYDFDAAARSVIPRFAEWIRQWTDPASQGLWYPVVQASSGDPYLFRAALARNIIPNTAEGLQTLATFMERPDLFPEDAETQRARQFVTDFRAVVPSVNAATAAKIADARTRWLAPQAETGPFPAEEFVKAALEGKMVPLPSTAPPLDPTPRPDPSRPPEIQLVAKALGWVNVSNPPRIFYVVGWREIVFYDRPLPEGGRGRASPFAPLPAGPVSVRIPMRYPSRWIPTQLADQPGLSGDADNIPWIQALAVPSDWERPDLVLRDEPKLFAFLNDRLGGSLAVPAEWAAVMGAMPGLAPSFPVPFEAIPPGSIVAVPPPGSGLPPTIKLPGTTGFVPVASVPPNQWVDLTAPPSPGPLPVVVQTVTPSRAGRGTGGGGTVLVNASGNPVNPDGTPPTVLAPASAGFSGTGSILAIAAIAGMVLMRSKTTGRR